MGKTKYIAPQYITNVRSENKWQIGNCIKCKDKLRSSKWNSHKQTCKKMGKQTNDVQTKMISYISTDKQQNSFLSSDSSVFSTVRSKNADRQISLLFSKMFNVQLQSWLRQHYPQGLNSHETNQLLSALVKSQNLIFENLSKQLKIIKNQQQTYHIDPSFSNQFDKSINTMEKSTQDRQKQSFHLMNSVLILNLSIQRNDNFTQSLEQQHQQKSTDQHHNQSNNIEPQNFQQFNSFINTLSPQNPAESLNCSKEKQDKMQCEQSPQKQRSKNNIKIVHQIQQMPQQQSQQLSYIQSSPHDQDVFDDISILSEDLDKLFDKNFQQKLKETPVQGISAPFLILQGSIQEDKSQASVHKDIEILNQIEVIRQYQNNLRKKLIKTVKVETKNEGKMQQDQDFEKYWRKFKPQITKKKYQKQYCEYGNLITSYNPNFHQILFFLIAKHGNKTSTLSLYTKKCLFCLQLFDSESSFYQCTKCQSIYHRQCRSQLDYRCVCKAALQISLQSFFFRSSCMIINLDTLMSLKTMQDSQSIFFAEKQSKQLMCQVRMALSKRELEYSPENIFYSQQKLIVDVATNLQIKIFPDNLVERFRSYLKDQYSPPVSLYYKSANKNGIIATSLIKPGTFLFEVAGEVLSFAFIRQKNKALHYTEGSTMLERLGLVNQKYGNAAIFIKKVNLKDSNCRIQPYFVEGKVRLLIITNKCISRDTELTLAQVQYR